MQCPLRLVTLSHTQFQSHIKLVKKIMLRKCGWSRKHPNVLISSKRLKTNKEEEHSTPEKVINHKLHNNGAVAAAHTNTNRAGNHQALLYRQYEWKLIQMIKISNYTFSVFIQSSIHLFGLVTKISSKISTTLIHICFALLRLKPGAPYYHKGSSYLRVLALPLQLHHRHQYRTREQNR